MDCGALQSPVTSAASIALPRVEVLLDHVVHNLRQVRQRVPEGIGIIAVVKDRAYGLGAVAVARALECEGVAFFAVARTAEARALREAGIVTPILVLGEATCDDLRWGAPAKVHFTVNSVSDLRLWNDAGCPVNVHCHVDTGMNRVGVLPSEIGEMVEALRAGRGMHVCGVYTHLASADVVGTPTVGVQLRAFADARAALSSAGHAPMHVHVANSAGLARFAVDGVTLVRPGIALYGCNPDPAQDFGLGLKTVVNLKASVVRVKRVAAGSPVSYGGAYVTPTDTVIATIGIGYGQGVPRLLCGRGTVLIRGRRYRIAGRVTMDYVMVDAGQGSDIAPADEAVVFGYQGNDCITIDEVALHCRTIGYEVLCNLSTSLPRQYVVAGRTVLSLDGLQI